MDAPPATGVGHPLLASRRPLPPRSRPADACEPNATLIERAEVSPSIVRLRIRPDAGIPAFEPGQYLALGLGVAGRLVQRPYSTSSPRGEADALEFLVRIVADGTLTPRLARLDQGGRLRMGRPKGLFGADPSDARRPLFVATGTGIAPLLSILETRLAEIPDGPARDLPLVVHGASIAVDLAGRSRLEALSAGARIAYVPAVSRPADPANAGWRGEAGRLDALLPGIVAAHGIDPEATVAYVCGNPGLIEAAGAALRRLGLPAGAIRTEAWVPATIVA